MSFLSKLSAIGKGVLGIFGLVQPVIRASGIEPMPVANEIDKIAQVIGIAESVGASIKLQMGDTGAKFGPAKLAAVLPSVKEVLLATNLIAGHKIVDESVFDQGAQQIVNGVVLVMSAIEHPAGTGATQVAGAASGQ